MMRDLDQLIAGPAGPSGYDLVELSSRVSANCRQPDDVRARVPRTVMLNELRCSYYERSLAKFGKCYRSNGIDIAAPAPEGWDGSWAGAEAWNERLAALPPGKRCLYLQQALAAAISTLNTLKPTYGARTSMVGGDHGLMVKHPKPGHHRDRQTAAWQLRYLKFTKAENVPAICRSVKQEGDFRWIEARNEWEKEFPDVFPHRRTPTDFGRQSLGFAYGMCGRCNNAHWVDGVDDIMKYNAAQTDAAKRIPLHPSISRFASRLSYVEGTKALKYRGPWVGEIDWLAFLGPAPKEKSWLDEIGPPDFDLFSPSH